MVFLDRRDAEYRAGSGCVVFEATRDGKTYYVVERDAASARVSLSRYCGDTFNLTNAAELLERMAALSEDEAEALLYRAQTDPSLN